VPVLRAASMKICGAIMRRFQIQEREREREKQKRNEVSFRSVELDQEQAPRDMMDTDRISVDGYR
jgi:hypothetical protein